MLAVVDYGVGNLFSLESSLKHLGIECIVTQHAADLCRADRIILPGVGAFRDAAARLSASGMQDTLLHEARGGKPILGICLGMQLLFTRSLEYGDYEGLDLIPGIIRQIDVSRSGLKLPHIGWNALHLVQDSPITAYNAEGDYVYFVHSFAATECDEYVTATTDYGGAVTAAVRRGNVFGTQFHPEKSGEVGLRMLRAFAEV